MVPCSPLFILNDSSVPSLQREPSLQALQDCPSLAFSLQCILFLKVLLQTPTTHTYTYLTLRMKGGAQR